MDQSFDRGQNILEVIKSIKDVLPQKQRQLCNYILLNYKTVGMSTVAELAKHAGVGTTTVMRLVSTLKYTTYNDFKKDLFSVVVLQENSSYQNIKYAYTPNPYSEHRDNNLSRIATEMVGLIHNFLSPGNLEQYGQAVTMLTEAKRIHILAQRSSKAAALYMEHSLAPFLYAKINQLSSETDFLFDKILRIGADEVIVIISNWPCCRSTVEVAQFCEEHGIPIILITNSKANPISRFCKVILDTNSVSSPCFLTPAMLIIEALSFDLAQQAGPGSTQSVENLEKMLKEKSLLVW